MLKPKEKNGGGIKRDVPLPKTLPSHLKPYDTNNDGVLDANEKRIMEGSKKMVRLLKKAPRN